MDSPKEAVEKVRNELPLDAELRHQLEQGLITRREAQSIQLRRRRQSRRTFTFREDWSKDI